MWRMFLVSAMSAYSISIKFIINTILFWNRFRLNKFDLIFFYYGSYTFQIKLTFLTFNWDQSYLLNLLYYVIIAILKLFNLILA